MRTRRECNSTVRDGGAHPGGALWGVRIFIGSLPRYSRKAYVWVGGRFLHMERERTVRSCSPTIRDGASVDVRAPSRVHVSGLVMGGKLWSDDPKSTECNVKSLTSQMQKRDVHARCLSVGFDKFNTGICGIAMEMSIQS